MPNRYSRFALTAALVAFTISSHAQGEDPPRTFLAKANDEIVAVDFSNGTTSVVVRSNGNKFEDIALLEEGGIQIVTASSTEGGKIFVFDAATGLEITNFPFASANAVATSPDGDVFATNATSSAKQADTVVVLKKGPTGLESLHLIDPSVEVDRKATTELADVEFVRSSAGSPKYEAGDLLVLVKKPAMLLRYCAGHIANVLGRDPHGACEDPEPSVVISTATLGSRVPTDFAFAPDGTILVVVDRDVLQFAADGSSLLGTFATLPKKGLRIDSTLLDPAQVVVSLHPGGAVQYLYPAGTQVVVTKKIASSSGIAVESGNAVFTPAGLGATVALQSFSARFDEALTSGPTKSNCVTILDPRGTTCPATGPVSLDNTCMPDEVEALVEGVDPAPVLPEFIQGFEHTIGNPATEVLRICKIQTAVQFKDLIEVEGNEFPWLGRKPACAATDSTMRPRFFLCEDEDPRLFEGDTACINLTSECNRDGANPWRFGSIIITGAREMRDSVKCGEPAGLNHCFDADGGVLNCQLHGLDLALSNFLPGEPLHLLREEFADVIEEFDDQDLSSAEAELVEFLGLLEDPVVELTNRQQSEIRSRALAALFTFELDETSCPI